MDHVWLARQAAASALGLMYWAGVLANARRVRRQIRRWPNLKPRGTKERLLYLAWLGVILVWLAQPLVIFLRPGWWMVQPLGRPDGWWALGIGLLIVLLAQAGTLWCYRAMGSHWRMGVRRGERTELVQSGPYARVRHPIYSFQMLALAGVVVLVPTGLSLAMLGLHVASCWVKSADEESYLQTVHLEAYREYRSRTGRFLPLLARRAGV
jgi:protein-S-isoprenylcysteine O-methyltransferase Ste14